MAQFDAILGAEGVLGHALQGFVPRPSQQRMAEHIGAALAGRKVLLVEAGTGTGKTFAYLVPALYSGRRVLISTGTRTLQDQLYHRDLPLLAGALGRPVRIALLKGRNNYLCRARLTGAGLQRELLSVDADRLMTHILDWAQRTVVGDMAEVGELGEAHPLRTQLTSTRESCTGNRCGEYQRCHVFDARRAALEADIVVVNHHLLLADLALKEEGFGDLLPSVDALILDEAHQLPDLTAQFFGVTVSSRQIDALAQDMRRELGVAGRSLQEVARCARIPEDALRVVHAVLGGRELRRGWQELDTRTRECFSELRDALQECADVLGAAAREAPDQEAILALFAARALALRAALGAITAEDADAAPMEGARMLVTNARGFTLSLLPYDVSARFRALIEQRACAWIFTSATLAVGEDFGHFAGRLGLEDAATLRLPSPFDYERQALLYLPQGMPEPSQPGYTQAVIEAAIPLLEAAGGGAFLLFTSYRALRLAAQTLRERPPGPGPLLIQGEAPREQLLRRFRASGQAVLLGTSSFWEGVDVQGPALRLVVIDKLPFAVPDDPIVRARIEHLQQQGLNPFRDYQLPEAVLALKQGVGRLIRSEEDRGVVAICDPRLASKSYGRLFLASLPPMPVTRRVEDATQLLRCCARVQHDGVGAGVAV